MHEEALTEKAKTLFPYFSKFKGFYLAGGTALALYIGHRISVDFDFFSSQPLPKNLLMQIKRVFKDSAIHVTYRAPEQLNLLIDDVQTTFFYYEYPLIDSLLFFQKSALASLREIAAMKAFFVGKRLSYRDYVDWYFLLSEKYVTFQEVLETCQKKFGSDFNGRLFLGQLVSLEDIPIQKINFLRNPVDRFAIQSFLEKSVRLFMKDKKKLKSLC